MTTNILATAYCACKLCCGPHAANLTAAGTVPREGITVAAPRAIPLGTRVAITIPNLMTNRIFTVEDRTARRFDGRFDIFFASHKRARRFGINNATVTILP